MGGTVVQENTTRTNDLVKYQYEFVRCSHILIEYFRKAVTCSLCGSQLVTEGTNVAVQV